MKGFKFLLIAAVGIGLVVLAFLYNPKHQDRALDTVGMSSVGREPNQGVDLSVKNFPRPQVGALMATKSEVDSLNGIIKGMKPYTEENSHKSVVDAANSIKDYANSNVNSQAAQYYAAIAEIVEPSKALLWRLGGIVGKSEHIYISVISGLKSFIYNRQLYSPEVRRGFDYLTIPEVDSERFSSISQFQDFIESTWLPAFQRGMDKLVKLYDLSANGGFEFLYDRSLVAGGIPNPQNQDRYVRFVRPYLAATIFYGKLVEGGAQALISYNLDDLPKYLNELMFNTIVDSKLRKFKDLADWSKEGFNVKINTPQDYHDVMAKYPALYSLRTNHDKRRNSLEAFKSAQLYNLSYIGELRAFAQLGNQNEYVVDARELTGLKDQQPEKYQKLARAIWGRETFTDPYTGHSVTTNFPALFTLNGNLRDYFPSDFVKGEDRAYLKTANKAFFYYEKGRPRAWNDKKYGAGGFVEGISSAAQMFEAHRILSYSEDGDVFGNTILPFFM